MPQKLKSGQIFAQMLITCPNQISTYGQCMAKHAENMDQNACGKEFTDLKACFRKARRAGKIK